MFLSFRLHFLQESRRMTLDIENIDNIEESIKNEILSGLKAIGLSTHEALTFYTLVTHSEMTAADLSQQTGIPDSKIYGTLKLLERRGMIIIQRGRPSHFQALKPGEAMANLKHELGEEYRQKLAMLEALMGKLSTLYASIEGREAIEVAYVIRGLRGIHEKMNNLIRQAQRNLLLFVADTDLLQIVEQSLVEAYDRDIQMKLGLNEQVELTSPLKQLFEIENRLKSEEQKFRVKTVVCQYGLLVVDDQTLLDLYGTMAVLTQRPTIIQYIREYYDTPKYSLLSYPDEKNI